MKHSSALIELIILCAMMASWVPMFAILLFELNSSDYTWMRDKTIMENTVSIEWTERDYEVMENGTPTIKKLLVPNVAESSEYSKADVLMSLVIFDEYAPDSNIITMINANEKDAILDGTQETYYIDLTLEDNFRNKYDYLPMWFQNTGLDIGARPDVPYYLNWIQYKDESGKEIGMWSFREDYDLRYEE